MLAGIERSVRGVSVSPRHHEQRLVPGDRGHMAVKRHCRWPQEIRSRWRGPADLLRRVDPRAECSDRGKNSDTGDALRAAIGQLHDYHCFQDPQSAQLSFCRTHQQATVSTCSAVRGSKQYSLTEQGFATLHMGLSSKASHALLYESGAPVIECSIFPFRSICRIRGSALSHSRAVSQKNLSRSPSKMGAALLR